MASRFPSPDMTEIKTQRPAACDPCLVVSTDLPDDLPVSEAELAAFERLLGAGFLDLLRNDKPRD